VPKVTYRQPSGESQTVQTDSDVSLMWAAFNNSVEGIVAECGGHAMCATCHVYVDLDWLNRVPAMDEVEDELLDDAVSPRSDRSRLSCQLVLTDDMDGIVVDIPESQ
jgi:2Fe-2S ferredoxin